MGERELLSCQSQKGRGNKRNCVGEFCRPTIRMMCTLQLPSGNLFCCPGAFRPTDWRTENHKSYVMASPNFTKSKTANGHLAVIVSSPLRSHFVFCVCLVVIAGRLLMRIGSHDVGMMYFPIYWIFWLLW